MSGIEDVYYLVEMTGVHSQPATSNSWFRGRVAVIGGMCLVFFLVAATSISSPVLQIRSAAESTSLVSLHPLNSVPSGRDMKFASVGRLRSDLGMSPLAQAFSSDSASSRSHLLHLRRPHAVARPSATGIFRPSVAGAASESTVESKPARSASPANVSDVPSDKKLDALIDAFLKYEPEEWEKLILYSNSWFGLAPHVFRRIEQRADRINPSKVMLERETKLNWTGEGKDKAEWVGEKQFFLKLLKDLKAISVKQEAQDKWLQRFRQSPAHELESLVASSVDQISVSDFAKYVMAKVGVAKREENLEEAATLVDLLKTVLEMWKPSAGIDEESAPRSVITGQLPTLAGISNSSSAESQQSKLILPSGQDSGVSNSELYMTGKDTDMTKEEFKDIQFQHYAQMVAANERLLPVEIRILKEMFRAKDPKYREYILQKAFESPPLTWNAEQIGGPDELYSTPQLMLNCISLMLQAFDQKSRERGGVGLPGQDVLLPGTEHEAVSVIGGIPGIPIKPETIKLLQELQKLLIDKYF